MDRASKPLILAAFLIVCTVWGSTYLAIRVALESFPPFMIGAMRFLVAGGLLFAFLRARGERSPTAAQWGSAAVTGALYFAIGNGFVNVAERSVASGLVSVLVATMPLWATLFSRFFGDRTSPREWIGLGLGLAGVLIMNVGGELRAGGAGALFAVLAPMGWALGSIASKRLPLPPAAMATSAQMLSGGVTMSVVSLVTGEHVPAAPPARAIVACLYLALFGSLIGFSAFTYLLRHTRTSIATSYAYVNPVIALGLGVALAGERVDPASMIGGAVILGAVLLLSRSKAARARTEGPLLHAPLTHDPRSPTRAE